jgi:cyanophycinase
MIHKTISVLCPALIALFTACAAPGVVPASGGEADPAGSLFIVGGGPRPDDLMTPFLELVGGAAEARVLVLPMSSGSPEEAGEYLVSEFRRLGADAEWRILGAQAEEGARPVGSEDAGSLFEGFNAIWISGGDQNRFMRAVAGTPAVEEIRDFYLRGGVVGGTSAGAAVMSPIMITGEELRPGGDRPTETPWTTIMPGNVVTVEGLALLPGAVVDQHFLRRRRSNRLLSVVLENPELVGVGIDESTAVVVEPGGEWRVLGRGKVMVVDARRARVSEDGSTALDVRLHLLSGGDRYDPGAD